MASKKAGDKSARKVIVSCGVTGSIHVPSLSEFLPVTPDEIAKSAIDAARAGAAILHLHARDPATGKPTADPAVFAEFIPIIEAQTDAIINISTGGGLGMSLDDRTAAVRQFNPELCSLNMGSLNFGIYGMTSSIKQFKHDWEREYIEMTRDFVFRNTFADIEYLMRSISELGTRFEFECFDVSHLYNLAHFLERGLIEPPLFIQMVFGILGGPGADLENLLHEKAVADRLFGNDYEWTPLGAGRHQMAFGTVGALLGSNVRVGLEDSIYIERGKLAASNAEQVLKISRILSELSLSIATPAEARSVLGLRQSAGA